MKQSPVIRLGIIIILGVDSMDKKQALELLKDIVGEIDYDIYKSLFIEGCMEDPEVSMYKQNSLLRLLGKHVIIEYNTGETP